MTRTPILPLAVRVVADAWRRLPSDKLEGAVSRIAFTDLGAVHGRFDPDTGRLELNPRLFGGDMDTTLDERGLEHARRPPVVPQALHTTIHEFAHAIGEATGLDTRVAWRLLSGWEDNPEDISGTSRYMERRPGWVGGPSPWRYRRGTWFAREYSSKSPFEDFADVVTYRALGWTHVFSRLGGGRAKLDFVNRYVWGAAHGNREAAPRASSVARLSRARSAPGALWVPQYRRKIRKIA